MIMRARWPWSKRRLDGYVGAVGSDAVEPIRTSHLAAQVRGQWVALRNGEVVDCGATFDELMLRLHEREIVDVTVMRIPDESEAELIGLG